MISRVKTATAEPHTFVTGDVTLCFNPGLHSYNKELRVNDPLDCDPLYFN